ncbi:DctM-like transporter [Planctomycetes bacterium Pan216]|uniref:DctM-like transporter n=1 Tax=Kolteria novifilia TaxID=2527975 RepID=A0A518AZE7_9BACT|nr:DctM-like transporter [Planctomycetes bacterium Pan216]
MIESARRWLALGCGTVLPLFVLAEVNYPRLQPQSSLAIFAMFGLVLCFLENPLIKSWKDNQLARAVDLGLSLLVVICCLYVVVQTEEVFEPLWLGGVSLGNRAGAELGIDFVIGLIGLVLVLEATRRAIGLALPLMAIAFLAYSRFGADLPDWLFPHRGYSWERIVGQTFLQSQGVFGTALRVMFSYVFLFVVFGALLEMTGATGFILSFTGKLFKRGAGAPAKVAVTSSALMGSLSGSAVANAVTTGTFTIPMMRRVGFAPHVASAVEAAAGSGGALVPPVMGAAAYMMLEVIHPPVTYLQICRAAIIPACLYYLSLFAIVHLYSLKAGATPDEEPEWDSSPTVWSGVIFFSALAALIYFLLKGNTPSVAVTQSLGVILVLSMMERYRQLWPSLIGLVVSLPLFFWLKLGVTGAVASALGVSFVVALFTSEGRSWLRELVVSLIKSAKSGVALVAAAACVGIIIGVVTLTGIGTSLPAAVLPLAQDSLFAALALIMLSSIVLGMGLPSAVCYLLMATLVGPVLAKLGGVPPLAAHFFIFYFGMMSMVTPPVALAAYAAASIGNASIMKTGLAAFRFALVGFTLPYMFVYRPALLMLTHDGELASWTAIVPATLVAILGVIPLAAAIAGYLFTNLSWWMRAGLLVSSAFALFPGQGITLGSLWLPVTDIIGIAIFMTLAIINWRAREPAEVTPEPVAT